MTGLPPTVLKAWPSLASALRSSVSRNTAALSIQQVSAYLLPLITVPYLVRVLGAFGYGLVAFGQGLVGYLVIIIDYGFGYSATRRISQVQSDTLALSRISSAVWTVKFLLWLTCFAGLLALLVAIPKLTQWSSLFVVLYWSSLGNVLSPSWLFQGLERMGPAVIVGVIGRILSILAIFALVRTPDDTMTYAAVLSVSAIATGAVAAGLAARRFRIRFILPSHADVRSTLRDGWTLFLSNAAVGLYTVGNSFILGMLSSPGVVGYYFAAERIVKAVVQLPTPLSQALYPALSRTAASSIRRALMLARRLLFALGGVGLVLSCGLFFGAPWIARIFLGPAFHGSIGPMQIMAGLPLLIGISNVLGVQIMLPLGRDRAFAGVLFSAAILNIVLSVLLVPIWQQSGMAAAVLMSELTVVLLMVSYLQRERISPLRRDSGGTSMADSSSHVSSDR